MMRQNALLGACLLLICCVLPMLAQQPAANVTNGSNVVVPPLVSFSGVLNDLNGKPLTTITGVTFLLYKEEQGGAPLWLETQNVQPDKTGRYSVMLGSTTSTGVPSDLFVAGEARWLAVQPQGQPEQPRVMLLSVPYALKAVDAQTIGGLPPTAFVLAAPPTSNPTKAANAAVQPLATGTTPVTTAGGTVNTVPKFDAAADITNSQIFDNGTNVGIGTTTPAAKLDVKGASTVRGLFSLPATGTATASRGANSQAAAWTASAFNSSTAAAVNQNFRWQAEPVGNNTTAPSSTLNLLFGSGSTNPVETGLHIAANGQITFATGQTFPGTGSGNGTVTSVALTAPSTDFLVTGSPVTTSGTLGLGWIVAPDFNNTPNAIVKRDTNGNFSAGAINAATSFNLAGNVFDQGSYPLFNAFLGFAGNATMTGNANTGSGYQALFANTTGVGNTANGTSALYSNTVGDYNVGFGGGTLYANVSGMRNTATGGRALYSATTSDNTADGHAALYSTTTGGNNTAVGSAALYYNTTGSNNTAIGYEAAFDQVYTTLTNATAIGANSDVTQSNALVLGSINGVNGATANTNVGIGTTAPQYTLDVHGTGNFTGLVQFASGQQFPGAGTVTSVGSGAGLTGGPITTSGSLSIATGGVSNAMLANPSLTIVPGADLTGGGVVSLGGTTTLNLDTTKVPQLSAANTFSGAQTINNAVTITTTSGTALTASSGTTGVYGTGATYGLSAYSSAGSAVYGASDTGNGVWGNSGGGNGVYGSSDVVGVYGYSNSDNGTGVMGNGPLYGVFANSSAGFGLFGSSYYGEGVAGLSQTTTGVSGNSETTIGVYGSGPTYGVYGRSSSGYGVYGTTASPSQAGIRGDSTSSSPGVWGVNVNGGTGVGVEGSGNYAGVAGGSGVVSGVGVMGTNNLTTGATYGVYGWSLSPAGYGVYGINSATGGYAGYFSGNVAVTGKLTSGVKDFKIDHPLDPANKFLYHASVESSEMMNIYTGNVILDADGSAWVTLPKYFEALNGDFRYQLTAIGKPGPGLYIAEEIANNRFQIAGGTPAGKVSWQVTAVRQDAFAKAHPLIPEVEKTGEERGRYLHPVEHGQPASMGIDESRRAKMQAPPTELPKPTEQAALPQPAKMPPPGFLQRLKVPVRTGPKQPMPPQHSAVPQPLK